MMTMPVFSYIVTDSVGKYQTEARVCVSKNADMSDPVLDSGFSAEIDSIAFCAKINLTPRTRYYWTVTVRTDAGEEAASDINWFETGKMNEPWQAKWITCDSTNKCHPIFVKDIGRLDHIKDARLYICGLGLYEAYLNGEKISDEFLTPYCNNYNKWLQYQTYDVTKPLKKGGKLEVLLGNGWYKGRFGLDMGRSQKPYYGDTWKLIAELHITFNDDSEAIIATDESWQVCRSGITESSIYDGEKFDAALLDDQPAAVTLCTETLAPLTERLSTPVKIQEELYPVELIHTPLGEIVLDLGQNMAGIFRLHVNEPKGTVIHLQFGEILQNGNFYRDNLRSAKAEYTYISDGNARVIQPHFTFYGYRYVKVEGVTDLKKEDFTALVLYSELPKTGTLTTGHDLVNRLIQNAEWGQKGNFIDVPTDCPQRDERMGWTGDAQVFSATACFMRDSYAFFRKYLFDIAKEQEEHQGAVPDVIPSVGYKLVSSVWGDAACIIPWNLYLFYGDKAILAEQFDSMKAWVDYIRSVDADKHG
jgi:alpha-L-rhamnosidase